MARVEVERNGLVQALNEWKTDSASAPVPVGVAVDVGGTNTRVVLSSLHSGAALALPKFPGGGRVEILLKEFQEIAALVAQAGVKVCSAAICLAGRVQGTSIEFTNFQDGARDMTLADMPDNLFPPSSTRFLNDLEAASYGLLALAAQSEGSFDTYFAQSWGPRSPAAGFTPKWGVTYSVVAAGTGLGASLLVSLNASSSHAVFPAEFGHCLVPWPAPKGKHTESDVAFLSWLAERLSKGSSQLEYEDIVSGRGLIATYEYTSGGKGSASGDGGAIVAAADAGEEAAVAAVTLFYRFLMQAVQNVAVGSQAKAVFLAGDNQVHNETFWAAHEDIWKAELLAHPKTEWLADVAVFRQVKSLNLNLEGCVYVTKH